MTAPVIVTVQLPDGRWGHTYADDMPQAGMCVSDKHTYPTKEMADDAGKDRSDTIGKEREMFDRFLLDQEPPPVEWPNHDAPQNSALFAEIRKVLGLLTDLLSRLGAAKDSQE